jgi:TPP-dependent pyruvate/acetoin dehydrogenase alpha subunit
MSDLNPRLLVYLYRRMLRIRLVEEQIARRYSEQEMRCPVHLCIGQEAVAAGVCAALNDDDYVMGGHRAHGHYLAKGGDLKAMLAELYGKLTGCCEGKGGSMHLIDLSVGFLGAVPIVASTIPLAVGAAFGTEMRKENRVAVPFFGDGAIEEGVFHDSINFAALKQLPVVFVCENNLYSVYSHISVRQPSDRELCAVAQGHGVETRQADGNDVIEIYKLAQDAIAKARSGGGPTFLEFRTYRWREHCGPDYDDHLAYRHEGELAGWQQHCPIKRLEGRLLQNETLSSSEIDKIASDLTEEIDAAFEFAKNSPFPAENEVSEHIYAQ